MNSKMLDKKIILFGTGSGLNQILKLKDCLDFQVEFLVDNDNQKHGKYIGDWVIKSPNDLLNIEKDDYTILIASSYVQEISKQLDDLGFIKNVHYFDGFTLNPSFKSIEKYKNIYQGKRAFLIGNGPSLKIDDLDLLKNEITFAANKIYLAYDQTSWRPTYYFVEDVLVAENNHKKISSLSGTKFLSMNIKNMFKNDTLNGETIWLNQKAFKCKDENVEYKFSQDLLDGFYGGWTVMYMMLQVALYMGIKEIYLLGIDFNFNVPAKSLLNESGIKIISNNELNHFHPNYREKGEYWYSPALEKQYGSFAYAKEVFESLGGKIVNCSRFSKLDVFEMGNLERILEGEE